MDSMIFLNEVCKEARYESNASDEGGFVSLIQRSGDWTTGMPHYRQVHIAHRIMTLKLMLCGAHSRWGGAKVD